MGEPPASGFAPRPDLWSLDPDVLHLNHGSFGAVPRRTQLTADRLRKETERNPMAWFRGIAGRIAHSRSVLADYLGVDRDGFALIPNASAGITAALAAIPIAPGSRIVMTDHAYGAVRCAAQRYATRRAANLITVPVPLESADDELVHAVAATLDERTAVILIDQITSATAMAFPVTQLVALARSADVPIVVDGAHAPALLDTPVADKPDFWLGNFHKWACAPRGTAGLYTSPPWRTKTLPPVASWSEHDPYPERFDQQGTLDYVPWLAAPTALDVLSELRWPARRTALTAMLDAAAHLAAKALGTSIPNLTRPAPTMRLVPMPTWVRAERKALEALKRQISRELHAELALTGHAGRAYLRLSAHAYNQWNDYERLAAGLPAALRRC